MPIPSPRPSRARLVRRVAVLAATACLSAGIGTGTASAATLPPFHIPHTHLPHITFGYDESAVVACAGVGIIGSLATPAVGVAAGAACGILAIPQPAG